MIENCEESRTTCVSVMQTKLCRIFTATSIHRQYVVLRVHDRPLFSSVVSHVSKTIYTTNFSQHSTSEYLSDNSCNCPARAMADRNQSTTQSRVEPVVEIPLRRPGQPTSAHHCDTLRTILRVAGGDTTGLRHARKDELCRRVDELARRQSRTITPMTSNGVNRLRDRPRPATLATPSTAPRDRHGSGHFLSVRSRLSGRLGIGNERSAPLATASRAVTTSDVISVEKPAETHESQLQSSSTGDSSSDEPLITHVRPASRHSLPTESETEDDGEDALFFPEQPLQTCESCLSEWPQDDFPNKRHWPDCEHDQLPFCKDCLAQYIAAQIESSGFESVTCPHTGCTVRMSIEQIQTYAAIATRDRHLIWVNKQAVETNEEHLNCAGPNCAFSGDIDKATFSWMTCPECRARTCTTCETLWHPDSSHDENLETVRLAQQEAERAARQDENDLSTAFIQQNTKACPGCHNKIEKNGGCNHMTCRHPCNRQFCWVCLADYGPILEHGKHHHRPTCQLYRAIVADRQHQAEDLLITDESDSEEADPDEIDMLFMFEES
jgi:hypothetical protein